MLRPCAYRLVVGQAKESRKVKKRISSQDNSADRCEREQKIRESIIQVPIAVNAGTIAWKCGALVQSIGVSVIGEHGIKVNRSLLKKTDNPSYR